MGELADTGKIESKEDGDECTGLEFAARQVRLRMKGSWRLQIDHRGIGS